MCQKLQKSEVVTWGPLVELAWNDPVKCEFMPLAVTENFVM